MTVTLTSEQEKFIAEQLKTGHYRSPDDIVAESLSMLQAQEKFIQTHASELREKLAIGMGQIHRGETIDGKIAIQNLRNELGRRENGGK